MCLEFLCSWSHRDEDGPGPEHNRPYTPRTGTTQNNRTEHQVGNYYPEKDEAPPRPRSEPSINGSEAWNDDYTNAYSGRNEPPSKPLGEPFNGIENQVVNGPAVNGYIMSKSEHPNVSSMALNGGKVSKAVHPRPSVLVPDHVGNNTVLAPPVHQPNPGRGDETNVSRTNDTHYPDM
jgi:hypothetical protein